MKRKTTKKRPADKPAWVRGQIAALVAAHQHVLDDLAGVKARLDELESWRKSYERQSVRSDVVQEFADIRARLDKLEVVREPHAPTETQA